MSEHFLGITELTPSVLHSRQLSIECLVPEKDLSGHHSVHYTKLPCEPWPWELSHPVPPPSSLLRTALEPACLGLNTSSNTS